MRAFQKEMINAYGMVFTLSSNFQLRKAAVTLVNSAFDCGIKQMDNNEQGYLLLLNHNFLPKGVNQKLKKLHVFIEQGCSPFSLNTEQTYQLNKLFDKILDELSSSYKFKNDLLTILLAQLLHFMIKNFASSPAAA